MPESREQVHLPFWTRQRRGHLPCAAPGLRHTGGRSSDPMGQSPEREGRPTSHTGQDPVPGERDSRTRLRGQQGREACRRERRAAGRGMQRPQGQGLLVSGTGCQEQGKGWREVRRGRKCAVNGPNLLPRNPWQGHLLSLTGSRGSIQLHFKRKCTPDCSREPRL